MEGARERSSGPLEGDRESLPALRWPLMFIADGERRPTGWVVLHAPIQSSSRKAMFAELRGRGFGFIGMTSFLRFPAGYGSDPLDYAAVCEGWCHCFREPDRYLPAGAPRVLLSYSDFTDPALISPRLLKAGRKDEARWDFVYVGADSPWKMAAKNWPLARRCLPRLCRQLGLRGLVVNVPPTEAEELEGMTVRPLMPYGSFLRALAGCRFLFVPSRSDPSPRILAEALCLDVPLLACRELLGGWQYVDQATGVFFDGEDDVVAAAATLLTSALRPRAWYAARFGPEQAERGLRALLEQVEPGFRAPGPLRLVYRLSAQATGRDSR